MEPNEFERKMKHPIKKLTDEYANMANVDLATQGVEKSEKLLHLAEGNLNKIANNMEDLSRLEGISKKTVTQAMEFQKNTNTLKKEMSWLNKKNCVYMTAGAGGLGGLVYLFYFVL